MKKLLLLALFICFTISLLGCGTIKGLGEDISTVGGWFTRGSDHVKENMGKKSDDYSDVKY